MAHPKPVILCLTQGGNATAERLEPVCDAIIHGLEGRTEACLTFTSVADHIRELFLSGTPVIGICAAGILIRALGPVLSDKREEHIVISVAEDGSAVVPLLGGHRGANRMAVRLASALGIPAAITTASDVTSGLALDDPPDGWTLTNPEDAKGAAARMLGGAPVIVEGNAPFSTPDSGRPQEKPIVLTTERPESAGPERLVYRSRRIAIGVGCARGCPPDELSALVDAALAGIDAHRDDLTGIFTIDLKADEAAILDLARDFDVPLRLFTAERLDREADRLLTPSDIVFKEVGCHGVAEAAALIAAGPDARLAVPKQKSANATVAIAVSPDVITALPGRARGQVSLIGIGPGASSWRTPEASRLIANADELIGYGFYIDLLGVIAKGKPRTDFPLGGEEARCRHALEQAAQGRHVAMICSGDAGIYAMGALVYELMDRDGNGLSDAARRVEIVTAPGVSAMQAAAARIGAPLGHDFCAISLSDLLTPRTDIVARVRAAAEGDFVVAIYNPVSRRRRDLFIAAISELAQFRPPDTPVILARNLGRVDERVLVRRIDAVSSDEVDMMTVVLVGSSTSRFVRVGGRDRVYTPRGYADKLGQEAAE
ncbi:MAG: precorrin-3B C(17)-methyltransferase [Pseudomonadota bacterium]